MRLDLSGIGDSQPRPGAAENIPYLPQALDDIDAAVRYLREHHRVGHCQLVGLCAGAYNGFRAAVAGTAVDVVVMINPLLYLSVGDAPVDMGERQSVVVDSIRGYRRNISSWSRWRTLLTDPQKVLRVLGNMAGMVRDKSHRRLRDGLRLLGVPLHNDLPSEMLKLAKQNTQLRFVFSPDEHGESLLWSLGGATVKRLIQARKITITASKGADHLYTLLDDRQELFSTLTALIDPQAAVESAPDSLPHPASLSVSKGMA
jgi:pimeloyl-ACP methyl ester carboxylesterase